MCFAALHSTHAAVSSRASQREYAFPLCGLLSNFNLVGVYFHAGRQDSFSMPGRTFSLRPGTQEYDKGGRRQSQEVFIGSELTIGQFVTIIVTDSYRLDGERI